MGEREWVVYLDAAEWIGPEAASDEFNGWSIQEAIARSPQLTGGIIEQFEFDPEANGTSISRKAEQPLRHLLEELEATRRIIVGAAEIFESTADPNVEDEAPRELVEHTTPGQIDGPFPWTEPGVLRGYVYNSARPDWSAQSSEELRDTVIAVLDRAGLVEQFSIITDGPDGVALDASDRAAFSRAAAALGLRCSDDQ